MWHKQSTWKDYHHEMCVALMIKNSRRFKKSVQNHEDYYMNILKKKTFRNSAVSFHNTLIKEPIPT